MENAVQITSFKVNIYRNSAYNGKKCFLLATLARLGTQSFYGICIRHSCYFVLLQHDLSYPVVNVERQLLR